jgi:hypothetical protein
MEFFGNPDCSAIRRIAFVRRIFSHEYMIVYGKYKKRSGYKK